MTLKFEQKIRWIMRTQLATLIMVSNGLLVLASSVGFPESGIVILPPQQTIVVQGFHGRVSDLVDSAKVLAKRWQKDATLVEINVPAMGDGRIHPESGTSPFRSQVSFLFVSPTTGEGLSEQWDGRKLSYFRPASDMGDAAETMPPIPDGFIDLTEAVELMKLQKVKFGEEIHAKLSGTKWTFKGQDKLAIDAITGTVITAGGVPVGYDAKRVGQWLPLASKGDVNAQLKLGEVYESKNKPEAIKWYRKAADQGNAEGQWRLGMTYYDAGNQHAALQWLRKAADQGYAKAQSSLGFFYQYEQLRFEEAYQWFKKAAAQGDPSGENGLGMAYQYGRGVPQNYSEARKQYQQAAAHGNQFAANNLRLLERFLAQPSDKRPAPNIDIVKGTTDQAKKAEDAFARLDFRTAYRLWSHLEGEDSAVGLHNLGLLYVFGLGVDKNPAYAQMKFQEACHAGRTESCAWKETLIRKYGAKPSLDFGQIEPFVPGKPEEHTYKDSVSGEHYSAEKPFHPNDSRVP